MVTATPDIGVRRLTRLGLGSKHLFSDIAEPT